MRMFVVCPECGEQHSTDDIDATDIESTFEGWDRITYVCPVTGVETRAVVRVKR